MARPARFRSEDLVAAAARVVAERGPAAASVSAIAAAAGAPTGSLYHRFPSREALLAEAWLDVVERFEAGFVAALESEGALAAALFTPRWARANPAPARLLLVHRREELVAGEWPAAVAERAAALGAAPRRALRACARARLGSTSSAAVRRVVFALVDVPYAAVRRHLGAGERVPPEVDELIELTVHATLGSDP